MAEKHTGAEQLDAIRKIYEKYAATAKTAKQRERYAWWAKWLDPSPLGREVADILGQVFLGIYHIDHSVCEGKVDWSSPDSIIIALDRSLATYDGSELTWLVVLSHDRAIRLEISARSHQRIELMFHQRVRTGCGWERHPTMESAVTRTRELLGLGIIEGGARDVGERTL